MISLVFWYSKILLKSLIKTLFTEQLSSIRNQPRNKNIDTARYFTQTGVNVDNTLSYIRRGICGKVVGFAYFDCIFQKERYW